MADLAKIMREHDARRRQLDPKSLAASMPANDDPTPDAKACTRCEALCPPMDSPFGWCYDMYPGDICRACKMGEDAERAKRRERAERQAREEAGHRAMRRLIESHPKRFRHAVIEHVTGDARQRADAWMAGESWLLYLSGMTGAGKSHVAYAVLHQWAATHIDELAARMPIHHYAADLYRTVQKEATMDDPDAGTTALLCRTPAVVLIDDLGVGKPTEWVIQELQRIIHHRDEEMLPTIITTNLPLAAKSDERGNVPDSITRMFSARFARRMVDGIGIEMTTMYTGESQR